jgi:hypothetical protein
MNSSEEKEMVFAEKEEVEDDDADDAGASL